MTTAPAAHVPLDSLILGHLEMVDFTGVSSSPEERARRLVTELERLDLPVDPSRRTSALVSARYHFSAVAAHGVSMPLHLRAAQLLSDLRHSGFLPPA